MRSSLGFQILRYRGWKYIRTVAPRITYASCAALLKDYHQEHSDELEADGIDWKADEAVFRLRYEMGMGIKEIGESLGIKKESVNVRLNRVFKRFRTKWAKDRWPWEEQHAAEWSEV